jgi:hypothetical protein
MLLLFQTPNGENVDVNPVQTFVLYDAGISVHPAL